MKEISFGLFQFQGHKTKRPIFDEVKIYIKWTTYCLEKAWTWQLNLEDIYEPVWYNNIRLSGF